MSFYSIDGRGSKYSLTEEEQFGADDYMELEQSSSKGALRRNKSGVKGLVDSDEEEDYDEAGVQDFMAYERDHPEDADETDDPELAHYAMHPDVEFDGEFGYWLVKLIRGKTTGRKLKRNVFKFACLNFLCGFALIMVAAEEQRNLAYSTYITIPKFGASIQSLTTFVSVTALLMSMMSSMAIKYWASLCTNAELLGNLIRCYLGVNIFLFAINLWLNCVIFLTFKKVKIDEWRSTIELASIWPCWITTVIFMLTLLFSQAYYIQDIHYLLEDMSLGGSIKEPNPPENTMDLTDVTITQSLMFLVAVPFVLLIQLYDIIKAILKRCFAIFMKPRTEDSQVQTHKRRNICIRIFHSIFKGCINLKKCLFTNRNINDSAILPTSESSDKTGAKLEAIQRNKEEIERQERERQLDEMRKLEELDKINQKAAYEEQQRIAKDRDRIEEERRRQEQEALKQEQERKDKSSPTLNVLQYKTLWTTLGTSGSFQCKLKSMPSLTAFTEHLKKQGFHVVFAVNPNPEDVEIGICNIRDPQALGPWFMARFLASKLSFSAVMKSEDSNSVTLNVKKFALAKILKIDVSAGK